MGTRSITTIIETVAGTPRKITTIYRQYDGYPSGHGKELFEFLKNMRICNGYGSEQKGGKWANGAGCLAAQLIKKLKDDIGGIYIEAPRTRLDGEDYGYEITIKDASINVVVRRPGKKLFDGTVSAFGAFCGKDTL